MPVFQLDESIRFPPPELAGPGGLLAVGGDLSPARLIAAYSRGIFPWYSQGDPILWWFTSPRLIIDPKEFHVPKRLARYARSTGVTITRNSAFAEVIRECAAIRTEAGDETWLLPEMIDAYNSLFKLGYCHSVECWHRGQLGGGLYGIALGKVFFGESMFSRIKCGSQFALMGLVEFLLQQGYRLIDCQMTTAHLKRFGAREVSGRKFRQLLQQYIKDTDPDHRWNDSG
ncbi:leucyl/phenylalanyl-tRNA--protein transferase [Desulforhopalus singaporensis]|nr:leucyl/phenylalanyl-tRNA--protein transferase [Desulforhopalus singaporensis]